MSNILCVVLYVLQYIIFIHGQKVTPMAPIDVPVPSQLTLSCASNTVAIVRTAFSGVAQTPGTFHYTPGDCIVDGMSSISCLSDTIPCIGYISQKKLSQCSDQLSDYFHIEYDCVPISMDDPSTEYDVCQTGVDITSDHGIIRSPGYPSQVQLTTIECLRAIHIPDNKTLHLWLTDLYIGSLSTNCADDHVYVVDSIQTYKHCGDQRHAYSYLCSSTILIQYLIKTDLSIYRGMRMYFEITDRPVDDTCPKGTPTPVPVSTTTIPTIEPSTTTETPLYAQFGIVSPTQSFQICSGQSHTIHCPDNYAVAILKNILGVALSGQCEPYDLSQDCAATFDQLLTCRQTCSFQYPDGATISSCSAQLATYQYIEYQCIPRNTDFILANASCSTDGSKTEISFARNGRFQSYNYPTLTQTNCTYRLKTNPGDIIHIYALDISLNSFMSSCNTNQLTFIEDNESKGTSFCEQRTYSLIYSSCSNELDLHYLIHNDTYELSFGVDIYFESQTRPFDWPCGDSLPTSTSLTTTSTIPTTPEATSITTGPFIGAQDTVEHDICHNEALNYACALGYTFMIIDAYYGVKSQPENKCGYVGNDCVQEATSTITQCQTDSPNCYLPYTNKRRLAQCSDQYADYLHIIYQCVPSSPTGTPSTLTLYDICDNSSSIRDFNGVITSPDFPQHQIVNNECKRDIYGVHDRLLKIWLSELSIVSGGQRSSDDLSDYSNQPDLIIYKTNEFDDIEQISPAFRDTCVKDYLIISTRYVAYIFCGLRKLYLEPICTSSATIQYKTTIANPGSTGFKLYFEWIEKPMDITCAGTPATVDPSASTTTPPDELLPIWAENLDISPILSKHICFGAADSIKCPRSTDYVIAIEDTKYGVTTSGICDLPSFSDCYQKGALSLTCTHICLIDYIVPKPLSQCQNQTADYLSIDYECLPTRLANEENPIDICASSTTDTIALDKGLMTSPQYPSLNSAYSCSKTIETTSNKIWMIYIVDLFLEREDSYGNCQDASLTVHDGNDIRIICGLQQPQLVLTSCSNLVQFSFRSNQQALGYRGFKVFFTTIDVPAGWACQPSGFSTTTQQTTVPTLPPTTLIPPTLRVAAYGGTIPDNVRQYCQLPFTYQGNSYSKCITGQPPNATAIQTDPWCSLTTNYDADHQWGFCDIGVTDATYYDVCRSRSQRLQCSDNYVIDVVRADLAGKIDGGISCSYNQTDCFQSDLSSIQTACAGKKSCMAYHTGKTLASCQNHLSAYLRLEYTCVPDSIPEIQTYDLCNNNTKLPDNTRRGFLISPNFPNTPSDLDCIFDLQPSKLRQDIYIYTVDMGLNSPNILGESCTKDRLLLTAGSNRRETCGLSFTNLLMKSCHTPLAVQLIRTPDAIGRGVKLYFEFRDRPSDEICDQIITPSTPSTLIPTTIGPSTIQPLPSYFPEPSNRMITTLCFPDTSGSFGANNFRCPNNYTLVILRAFYGTGNRCAFTPGDCTREADHVYRDCSGKQLCSVSFENSITLQQCNNLEANYLSVEYQCLPALAIAPNVADLCANETNKLIGSSGALLSPSYPFYNQTECVNVTLMPPDDSGVVVYMYLLDLSIGGPNVETDLCTDDYLLLSYECNNQIHDQYFCGTRPTELLFDTCSPTDKIFVSYNLTNSADPSYRGFALLYHLLPKASISTVAPITTTTKPSTSNYVPIIGGAIGGLLLVILCLSGYLYYRRYQSRSKTSKERPVLFKNEEDTAQESTIDIPKEQNVSIPSASFGRPEPMVVTSPFYPTQATEDDSNV